VPPGRHLPEIFGFALGATATVAQVVLVREALSLCGGNELALGLGLSLWLVGVALGALAAGWLPRPGSALASTAVAAAPAFGAAWAILRLHRSIVDLPAGGDPSLPAIAALLAVGTGLGGIAVGFLFTVAARAAADGSDRPVSRLYTAEAAGALVGGLAFSLVMAGRISHPAALAIAAGVGALGAGAVLSGASRAAAWAAAALLIVAAAGGPLAALDQWTSTLAFEALDAGELVTSTDSPYGRLAVGRIEDQHQLYSDGRLVRAFPDPWRRSEQIHLAMAQHPDPRRVLLVGGERRTGSRRAWPTARIERSSPTSTTRSRISAARCGRRRRYAPSAIPGWS